MSNEQMNSVLKLERIAFEEIQYSRMVNSRSAQIEYEMNFTRQVSQSDDNKHFRVSLIANVWSKGEEKISLSVTVVGFFFCDVEDEKTKQELINKNSIAILFPYLRSQISLVTTQPDMLPITIQPMNIVAMFDVAEEGNT